MVVTEYPPTPSKGVLAELANVTVGTNVDEDTDENVGNPQSVPVVWSELLAPPPMELLGEVTCRVDVTTTEQVPGSEAGQVPQVRTGTGGRVGGQQMRQEPSPARTAGPGNQDPPRPVTPRRTSDKQPCWRG